jgi:hypothetical protein
MEPGNNFNFNIYFAASVQISHLNHIKPKEPTNTIIKDSICVHANCNTFFIFIDVNKEHLIDNEYVSLLTLRKNKY